MNLYVHLLIQYMFPEFHYARFWGYQIVDTETVPIILDLRSGLDSNHRVSVELQLQQVSLKRGMEGLSVCDDSWVLGAVRKASWEHELTRQRDNLYKGPEVGGSTMS